MKKLTMGMMTAALALAAFCEVTPALVSENFFGSIKVDSKSEFTMVAAPFEGFASSFDDDAEHANEILARDVIAVEKMLPNDTISLHYPESTNALEEFHNYIARQGKYKIPGTTQTVTYMEWLASMWFEEETMTSHKFPDADVRLVPVGSGVFVGRDEGNSPAAGFSIYAYGQIPQSFDYTQTIKLKKGKTVLSGPGELAYEPIDLNKLVWDVTTDEVTGTERSRASYAEIYPGVTNILVGIDTPATSDFIAYYDAETQEQREFLRYKGRWLRVLEDGIASREDDAVIPAGMSFWYVRNSTTGSASIKWTIETSDASDDTGDGN